SEAGRFGRGTGRMNGTYDVRIWAIRVRKGRPKPYQVRWKAGTAVFAKSFATRGLAESFRSALMQATRRGEAFDIATGLPETQVREQAAVTWYQPSLDYINMKWPDSRRQVPNLGSRNSHCSNTCPGQNRLRYAQPRHLAHRTTPMGVQPHSP